MKPYDLLIFDWDGTLSDSAQIIVNSMQQAISALNLEPRSDVQIRELIGLGLADGMRILYPHLHAETLIALLDNYRRNWKTQIGSERLTPAEPPLFLGAEESLQNLADQGYLLCIATGKSRAGLNRSLQIHRSVKAHMIITKTADETANKPDPQMLKEILAELDVRPNRALMIGDTDYDVKMAKALHMDALGLACGVHSTERIMDAGAMAVINSVADLPQWLLQK